MNKKYLYLTILLVSIFWINAFSITIYVSPLGNDNNPGTRELPFASLQAAKDYVRVLRKNQKISEPVEIIIAAGIYNLDHPVVFTIDDSGTKNSPLIIKGQVDNVPVFSGGVKLNSFVRVSDKLWKTYIPEIARYNGTIQQLFVNGERAVRARMPNIGSFFKTKSVSESLLDTSKQYDARLAVQKINLTTDQVNALKSALPDFQNVIVSIHHAWDRTRKYIQGVSFQDSAIFIIGKPMASWNKLNNSSQFIFENSKAFLDAPGEWFLEQDGTLFYIPKVGETIENTTAIVPIVDQLIIMKGEVNHKIENIRFENLSFQYTRYIMSFKGNEPGQAAAATTATVMIDNACNIVFHNCEISHTGTNAIWLKTSCSDSKITHCYFHDLGVGGIKIGEITIPKNDSLVTKNIIVDNNIIRSGGKEFPTGVGIIVFNASDNVISHNEIADFGYSGISVGWVWGYNYSPSKRNKIIFNHIHHLGWGLLSDMGGVYLLGPSEGTLVSNNVIHHIYSYGYGGWGLYTDEGSTGIMLENNLVYKCKSSAFHQHYGTENIIRNNIFVSQLKAQLEATRVEKHLSFSFINNIIYFDRGVLINKTGWKKVNFFADYNLYWDTHNKDLRFGKQTFKEWKDSTGKDKHSIIADPMFIDPANYDFNFSNKSNISKIQFKPFDYSKAGVYGDILWKQLSLFDASMADQFDKMVELRMKQDDPYVYD